MPHLKKLHARLRDRKDVLVLALNVDDNLGVIEPFVNKHGIEFPVLPALEYQEKLDAFAIPVNLVVGRDGVIRYERLGFGGDGDKWVAEALKVVDEVRGAKRAPVGRASPARARRGGGS
jgi:hypothetical protein